MPTVIIYGSHTPVEESYTYEKNPKDVISQKFDFYFPRIETHGLGDGTVLTSSATATAVKWIHEHKTGKTKNPVKLVEHCSSYNKDATSIYDATSLDGER